MYFYILRLLVISLTFVLGVFVVWLFSFEKNESDTQSFVETQIIPTNTITPFHFEPDSRPKPGSVESISRTSIFSDPDYSHPLPAIKEIVKQKATHLLNTFYISKIQNFSNGSNHAWVYWKENNALILWEPYLAGRDNREYELVWSRRYLRFGKEIVPPSRFYQGSNFLTLMKDGLALKKECLHSGIKFVIKAKKGRNKLFYSEPNKGNTLENN